jgi:cytosine/adenosine deaminase-related metal-dependent hydrolase
MNLSMAAAPQTGPDEVVIQGGRIVSMDPQIGDLDPGDVHLIGGLIAAVAPRIEPGSRPVLDAAGAIVIPGLIDTHWHLWNSILRGLCSTEPERHYFPLLAKYGPQFEPQDIYWSTRLGLAEALSAGITTVADWAHNTRGPAAADASIQAHSDAGLRTRFFYSYYEGLDDARVMNLDDVARMKREWFDAGRAPLASLGVGLRNPATYPELDWRREWEFGQETGLPLSTHVADRGEADAINMLAEAGLLGENLQLVHGIGLTAAQRELIGDASCSVSITPWSELVIGFGYPDVDALVEAGVTVSLGADTVALTGNADLFSTMRGALNIAHANQRREDGLSAREVLAMATSSAAEALGIEGLVGSLTPGKRADVTIVRTDFLNTTPSPDAVTTLVLAAQPHNVEAVFVDGVAVKQRGQIQAFDPTEVLTNAELAWTRLRHRLGDNDLR